MPHIFQKEIMHPHFTGYEKFDSLYRLYDIFKDLSYFLVNLLFEPNETISTVGIMRFLNSIAKEYHILHYVVRCEKKSETKPISADDHLKKCAEYIQERLNQGYGCIVHEVISGPYPSNRLDWLYSFGIWYKNSIPQIEIYPATDAGSIKWGKLSPLDFISVGHNLEVIHQKNRDEKSIQKYQALKINEWIEQFEREMDEGFPQKYLFTNFETLSNLLQNKHHPLFDMSKIDSSIDRTKEELINLAFKYASYAKQIEEGRKEGRKRPS